MTLKAFRKRAWKPAKSKLQIVGTDSGDHGQIAGDLQASEIALVHLLFEKSFGLCLQLLFLEPDMNVPVKHLLEGRRIDIWKLIEVLCAHTRTCGYNSSQAYCSSRGL